jgi:hypothetical protein
LKCGNILTVVLEDPGNRMRFSFLVKKTGILGSRNFTEAEVLNFQEERKGLSKILSDSSKGFCRIIGSRIIAPSVTIGPHEEEKSHFLIRGWNLNLVITLEDPDFDLGIGWKPKEPIITWLIET